MLLQPSPEGRLPNRDLFAGHRYAREIIEDWRINYNLHPQANLDGLSQKAFPNRSGKTIT